MAAHMFKVETSPSKTRTNNVSSFEKVNNSGTFEKEISPLPISEFSDKKLPTDDNLGSDSSSSSGSIPSYLQLSMENKLTPIERLQSLNAAATAARLKEHELPEGKHTDRLYNQFTLNSDEQEVNRKSDEGATDSDDTSPESRLLEESISAENLPDSVATGIDVQNPVHLDIITRLQQLEIHEQVEHPDQQTASSSCPEIDAVLQSQTLTTQLLAEPRRHKLQSTPARERALMPQKFKEFICHGSRELPVQDSKEVAVRRKASLPAPVKKSSKIGLKASKSKGGQLGSKPSNRRLRKLPSCSKIHTQCFPLDREDDGKLNQNLQHALVVRTQTVERLECQLKVMKANRADATKLQGRLDQAAAKLKETRRRENFLLKMYTKLQDDFNIFLSKMADVHTLLTTHTSIDVGTSHLIEEIIRKSREKVKSATKEFSAAYMYNPPPDVRAGLPRKPKTRATRRRWVPRKRDDPSETDNDVPDIPSEWHAPVLPPRVRGVPGRRGNNSHTKPNANSHPKPNANSHAKSG